MGIKVRKRTQYACGLSDDTTKTKAPLLQQKCIELYLIYIMFCRQKQNTVSLSTKERYINYGCLCSSICFTVLIWNPTQSIILSYSHSILFDTDYIKYWLGSIHTYCSTEVPVIVALSHAEDNRADRQKVCVNEERSWKVSFLYKLMSMKTLSPNWKNFLVLNFAFKCKTPEATSDLQLYRFYVWK